MSYFMYAFADQLNSRYIGNPQNTVQKMGVMHAML
jgi:hypothetical protein